MCVCVGGEHCQCCGRFAVAAAAVVVAVVLSVCKSAKSEGWGRNTCWYSECV